jgi:hypothetical protein
MLIAQLKAEIVEATERIVKTKKGNFDSPYKEVWIAANENHIAVCQREIAALDKMLNTNQQ